MYFTPTRGKRQAWQAFSRAEGCGIRLICRIRRGEPYIRPVRNNKNPRFAVSSANKNTPRRLIGAGPSNSGSLLQKFTVNKHIGCKVFVVHAAKSNSLYDLILQQRAHSRCGFHFLFRPRTPNKYGLILHRPFQPPFHGHNIHYIVTICNQLHENSRKVTIGPEIAKGRYHG